MTPPRTSLLERNLNEGERAEMAALGLLDATGAPLPLPIDGFPERNGRGVPRHAISNPRVLNEAHEYEPTPASFSRGLAVDLRAGTRFLWISGTASVDKHGASIHRGDIRAQTWRTFRNITELLASEGADWHDIVRTTCYLRDIERDYEDFNDVRTHFLRSRNLQPLPASTGIQARLCRDDLLVEIEAIAIVEREPAT